MSLRLIDDKKRAMVTPSPHVRYPRVEILDFAGNKQQIRCLLNNGRSKQQYQYKAIAMAPRDGHRYHLLFSISSSSCIPTSCDGLLPTHRQQVLFPIRIAHAPLDEYKTTCIQYGTSFMPSNVILF